MSACMKVAQTQPDPGDPGGTGGKMQKQKSIVEIYTDWANHYLEKTKGKHKIRNLQTELSDGLLLTEVIEAVTHQRVPDITKKPKTKAVMVTNIQACLNFLFAKGVAVEEIKAVDVHEGNLKAILGLFFQLSRYKQQQKQLNSGDNFKVAPPSPAKSSSIPVPGSQIASPKKFNRSEGNSDVKSGSKCLRCPGSTSGNNAVPNINGMKDPRGNAAEGMVRPPSGMKNKLMQSQGMPQTETNQNGGKQSMLQRFKIGKTSNIANNQIKPGLGKRTSSSSGFSSARSDRSESSVSLSSDTNFPSPSALRRIQENPQVKQSPDSPKTKLGLRTKFNKNQGVHRDKSSSPKRSPKLGRSNGETEIKDYGMIDRQGDGQTFEKIRHYPPHAYSRSNSGISLKHTNISSHNQNLGSCSDSQASKIKPKLPVPSSGIPSPRVKPPAPPVRTAHSLERQFTSTSDITSNRKVNNNSEPIIEHTNCSTKQSNGQLEPVSEISYDTNNIVRIDSKSYAKAEPGDMDKPPAGIVSPLPLSKERDISTPDPSLTASFHSRTCSLPRQKRRGDCSPSPNVAIVSPMPNISKSKSSSETSSLRNRGNSTGDGNDEAEDPLRGIAPMAPLGGLSSRSGQVPRQGFSPYDMSGGKTHSIQTVNTTGLHSGCEASPGNLPTSTYQDFASGYLSDGDICRRRKNNGYISEGGSEYLGGHNASFDDGYKSEGGAEFYNRKAQQRLAYEQQRSAAEVEHRKFLEKSGKLQHSSTSQLMSTDRRIPGRQGLQMGAATPPPQGSKKYPNSSHGQIHQKYPEHQPLPQVLNRNVEGVKPTYKVVGGRKNVQKADSGIQTETSAQHQLTQQQRQWKAAMEHNKNVLTSQEQAMKEYLQRQQKEAEKHIKQYSPATTRKHSLMAEHSSNRNMQHNYGAMSMPGTPLGYRRQQKQSQERSPSQLGMENGNGEMHKPCDKNGRQFVRGGSLERHTSQVMNAKNWRSKMVQDNYSDSEYIQSKHVPQSPLPGSRSPKERRDNSKSLPKGTSALNYGLLLGQIQQKRQQRKNKSIDGSVSDSNYASYSEIQGMRGGSKSPYQWMQPCSTYSGWASAHEENMGSNESLNSISSSIKQARANSLNNYQNIQGYPPATVNAKQEETEYYGIPFMLQKNLGNKQINSQPTSPTHQDNNSIPCQDFSINKGSSSKSSLNYSSLPSYSSSSKQKHKMYSSEHNEDLNGSNVSLVSTGSSIYSNQEDKTNADISKLQRELADEHKKVLNLTSQLTTNAHVVSAFEQSLANMTARLHQITKTAERKDSELADLRCTIDKLRQSGADAGLIKMKRQDSGPNNLLRQASRDSVNSMSSAHSNTSLNSGDEKEKGSKPLGGKRTGWLRSSFSKAFSKGKNRHKSGSVSDCDDGLTMNLSDDTNHNNSHMLTLSDSNNQHDSSQSIKHSKSSSELNQSEDEDYEPHLVVELKRQLIEKDTLLTETRLEALSSVHQLESLKETVNKMKTELITLRHDNDKLHGHSVNKSIGSSESSLNTSNDLDSDKRVSVAMSESSSVSGPSTLDMSGTTDPNNHDSKSVSVVVSLTNDQELKIGTIAASGKLSWKLLDSLVERLFIEYIMLVDPVANLGLSSESIKSYLVGEISRKVHEKEPELLPYGYIIGDIRSIKLILHNSEINGEVDSIAFETLIPKSIIQRYVSLIKEHRQVIISGPPSTGKSYIAHTISELLVKSKQIDGKTPPRIESFTLTRENLNEFEKFVNRLVDECQSEEAVLPPPDVIILDNLHNAPNLDHLLGELSHVSSSPLPVIIGTMTQTTGTTTDLQLKCNFRWILFANHVEPVRGYLGRHLRRKLLAMEVETKTHNSECYGIIEWVAKAYVLINKFLESHCSQDATLSPSFFFGCPMDAAASRLWFINLWNLNLVPHIMDCVREGLLLYGKRASWDDPVPHLLETWPWQNTAQALDKDDLTHVRPDDVGYDVQAPLPQTSRPVSASDNMGSQSQGGKGDPLFNMLMTLQEAANTQAGDL